MGLEDHPKLKRMADEMRANIAALDLCPGHLFEQSEELFGEAECQVCKGRLKRINVIWFNRGVAYGRRLERESRA